MDKLVVLKLGEGSFEQGFLATLQIGKDGNSTQANSCASHPLLEITGKLPAAPEIPQYYTHWASAYRSLGLPARLAASAGLIANVSKFENCCNAAQELRDRLNAWLHAESFRPIREKLLEQLMPADTVRVIIQTPDIGLRRLPWHLWDLGDRYPRAEIALSAPVYTQVEQPASRRAQVRILAILGNSAGINTQADRLLLEQLPNAEITFLVEPQCQELTEQLWRQGWDILFFAGHSSTQANGVGRILINQTDSLTINQLKYAVKKAVESGLKIAIFNSCDGLGLAQDLADLQIPQIILMREPVPDRVAQEFLKSFLEAFARGETFYLAVREARERLQGLEDQFPCATWLPIICQNLAEIPPTWQGLGGKATTPQIVRRLGCRLRSVLVASVVATSIIMGMRQLGMLQPIELQAFDRLLQLRPDEQPDPRLLVVTVTEADIQAQPEQRQGSLSDLALHQLLQKLEQHQPRAIGLDIYRDFSAQSQPGLAAQLRQDHLIAVCKISDPEALEPGISPPPEIPTERSGFSDFLTDADGILRRHLLSLTPDSASPCTTPYAFSSQLAFRYLAAAGIWPKSTPEGFLQLGDVVFQPLEAHSGGYQKVDAWGHQVLLNYRSPRSPQHIATQVTLTDVLKGQLHPKAIQDRIILIGTTANSFGDYWLTPYSQGRSSDQQLAGVLAQAQMVSQILSAVLDQRPLLWAWPQWGDILWVWGWSLVGGMVAWRLRSPRHLGLALAGLQVGLCGLCFGLLVQDGCWVPLVPSTLALLATSGSVVLYKTSQARRQQNHI